MPPSLIPSFGTMDSHSPLNTALTGWQFLATLFK